MVFLRSCARIESIRAGWLVTPLVRPLSALFFSSGASIAISVERLSMSHLMRAGRRFACVGALAFVCAACGANGSAQSACGARGVPYVVGVGVPGGYAGAGWYDPGDPWPAAGDDSSGSTDDPGSGDPTTPGDDDDDSSSDDSSGDGSGGDDSGGDGSGGDGADSARIHVQGVGAARVQTFEGDVCFSCPLMCTLSTSTPVAGSSIGSSVTSFADACAHAENDLRRWAHKSFAARIASCRIVDASP